MFVEKVLYTNPEEVVNETYWFWLNKKLLVIIIYAPVVDAFSELDANVGMYLDSFPIFMLEYFSSKIEFGKYRG